MGIKVEKHVLEQLIKKFVNEHNNTRSDHHSKIDQNAAEEQPILPSDHMAVQLSHEIPDIADEEYLPSTVSSLANAASAIAKEVPSSQIEFFYNQLHDILKRVEDREAEARLPLMESLLFEALDDMLNESDEQDNEDETDDDLPDISDEEMDAMLASIGSENEKTPTAQSIAQHIYDSGHAVKDAIHSSTDTMNLDIGDVKSASKDFASFGHKPRKTSLPAKFAMHVTMDALKTDPSVQKMMSMYIGDDENADAKTAIAALDVKAELEKLMKANTTISPELAAEMHMNVTYDKLKKAAGENDESVDDAVSDVIKNISGGDQKVSIKPQGLGKSFEVDKEILIKYLKAAHEKDADDIFDDAEKAANADDEVDTATTSDPLQQYRNELRQISGQNPDGDGIYNADRLAQFFDMKGANAMRQGLATNTALKYTIVNHANQYSKSDSYDENDDPYGDFIMQMNNSFNDFAMSPGITDWIKAARKSPPKELNNPKQFLDGLEEIIDLVDSGNKSIYDIEDEKTHQTQIDLLKFAFENATNKKMMVKFRKDLQQKATEIVSEKIDGISPKDASKMGDMLMGNKARPVFTKLEQPKGNKIYDNNNANFIASFGLDENDYFNLEIATLSSIATYLRDNNNDIFDKIYADTENKGKVKASLSNSVKSLTSEYRGEYRQLERQLALLRILDKSDDFDLSLDMEENINIAMDMNRGDEGSAGSKLSDSDFGINENIVKQIKQITQALKSNKIQQAKYNKIRQIIERLG